MKVTYGKKTPTAATDPDVIQTHQIAAMSRRVIRDFYVVEWIPWLKYLPWYGRELKMGHEREMQLGNGRLNRVRQEMVPTALSVISHINSFHRRETRMWARHSRNTC